MCTIINLTWRGPSQPHSAVHSRVGLKNGHFATLDPAISHITTTTTPPTQCDLANGHLSWTPSLSLGPKKLSRTAPRYGLKSLSQMGGMRIRGKQSITCEKQAIMAVNNRNLPLQGPTRARLGHVAPLGRPRSVYKSDVEWRFVSWNGQMTLKVKVNASNFQYQLQESQDAYLVQIWWF